MALVGGLGEGLTHLLAETWRWKPAHFRPYTPRMDTVADIIPPGWLEILEESEAEVAAGQILSGEVVHRELRESIARLEAKAAKLQREATSRR